MASVIVRSAVSRKLSVIEASHSLGGERPTFLARALASTSLSVLFVLVYGGSNLIASRMVASSWIYRWELGIPFVPLFIVPYLSIDLFFVASFFLIATKMELQADCRRIAMAILIAGVCFILYPLTIEFLPPIPDGWTGELFRFLWSFDRPYNLVPSLHVALLSLLWPVYARRTSGITRSFLHVWLALIFLSPLLTWQHHVVDVVAGAMLGQLCIFSFPIRRSRGLTRSASGNFRVAMLYAGGSMALCLIAIVLAGWWLWLLWPSMSLSLITIAYLWGNSSIFRKTDGRLPISSRIVLGPYLLGVYVRVLIYRIGRKAWTESSPRLFCGRLLTQREALLLRSLGISAVLDLTAEHAAPKAFREVEYLNVPVLDLTRASEDQLDAASLFIDTHIERGSVYVHCALGVSRSAAVVEDHRRRIGRIRPICSCQLTVPEPPTT